MCFFLMIDVRFPLADQHTELDFYITTSLKQHVGPLGHIIT
jgi:hypothetical protein